MSIDTATGKEAPADISSERVKDIFSSIAKKYERFNAVSSFGAYKAWLAGMMRQALYAPKVDTALNRSYFFAMAENISFTRADERSAGASLPVAVSMLTGGAPSGKRGRSIGEAPV